MSSERITSENPDILTGSLDKTSLPNLLISLQNSKKTGNLDITSKYELTVFFDQGYPYFAAGGSGETLLGKILLNRNKITKYQYDKAAEEIKKNKDKRIGEILVSLGMITPHELNDYLELQLKEKILESFLYLEGGYEFTETNSIDNSIFYSKINTPELVHEGFQRFLKSSDIDFEIFDVEFETDLNDKTANIGLGPKELRLVQLLSQNKSLKDIENGGQFKKDEILRVVFLLGLFEIAKIKKFSINNHLIEVFKNFLIVNPLPELTDSNYTVKESELTDPTGEVLLLDDELEATAEREKLELKSDEDVKTPEGNVEADELTVESLDEDQKEDTDIEAAEADDSAAAEVKEEHVDDEEEYDEEQDIDILEATENFRFQDEYEGDQNPIEIKKSKKKKTKTKEKAKEKEVEVKTDKPAEETEKKSESKIKVEKEETVESEGQEEEIKIDLQDEDEKINIKEPGDSEEEIKIDETAASDEQVETEEEIKIEDETPEEQDKPEDNTVIKELEEFYEFTKKEDDYYDLLRVGTEATSEEIKDAYYALIKKFHPDANSGFPEDIKIKSEHIFTKVTKAYEILLDEQKRLEYDERDELNKLKDKANSIYEAELIYTEGEMLLRQRNYKEAEKKFFNAIELNPDESVYVGTYSWAKYLAAPDKDRVLDDVKKELNRAIEMDPSVEQNYYFLGSVYKFSENFARAEKNFRKAVEIDPNYIEAKRELRLIQNRKNQKGKPKESDKKIEKKFWSGLFKK